MPSNNVRNLKQEFDFNLFTSDLPVIPGIPRPEDHLENPFIGKDGGDYHDIEALQRANQEWYERNLIKK